MAAAKSATKNDFVKKVAQFDSYNQYKHLGEFLKNRRKEMGLSQIELGDTLGYTPQFVCNWERGTAAPPLKIVPKLVSTLKIEMNEWIALDTFFYYKSLKSVLKK